MKLIDIDLDDDRVQFVEAKPAGWAGHIKVNDLFRALEENDIPPQLWPNLPSDNKCLQRAMEDNRPRGRRHLVRPLKKAKGWSLVIENAEALDLERAEELARVGAEDAIGDSHAVEITGKVMRGEGDGHVSTVQITPPSHPLTPMIKESFKFFRGTDDFNLGVFKCSEDLSVWFSQTIIPWVSAVSTRSRGGSYYVLKGEPLDRLRRACAALESVSEYTVKEHKLPNGDVLNQTHTVVGGRIILKPEVCTVASVEILLDSVVNNIDKELDKLDEKLRTKDLGTRALSTQMKAVDSLAAMLTQYERVLGVGLDDVRARLAESKAGVGMAQLTLEANKDKDD